MNNYRRSVAEVVQVVKIADVTLRKRLAEFGATASGQLTVEQFRQVWLADTEKPPAMIQNQRREAEEAKRAARRARGVDSDESSVDEDADEDVKAAKLRRRKRREQIKEEKARARQLRLEAGVRESDDESGRGTPARSSRAGSTARATPDLQQSALRRLHDTPTPTRPKKTSRVVDPALQNIRDEMARLAKERAALGSSDDEEGTAPVQPPSEDHILKRIENDDRGLDTQLREVDADKDETLDKEDPLLVAEEDLDDPLVDEAVSGEIEDYMRGGRPAELNQSLDEHEQRRMSQLKRKLAHQEDDLEDLDEGELDSYLLDEHAVKVKTMIWNKMNREYLVKLYCESERKGDKEHISSSKIL